jgi:hypothetical protein
MLLEGADPDDPRTASLLREDRAPDVPRRQDRQRLLNLSRPASSGSTDFAPVDSTPSSTTVSRWLEHHFALHQIKVRPRA